MYDGPHGDGVLLVEERGAAGVVVEAVSVEHIALHVVEGYLAEVELRRGG